MKEYVSYKDILSHIDIKKGDIVNVSSDLLKLILSCREKGEKFDPNLFIDTILEKVGPTGTVLFPAYFWGFCAGQSFDYKNTPSQTGGLSNTALKRKDFRRTRHPMYSFAVWGKDQEYLCSLDNVSAFAHDSPFGYFYDRRAKNFFIGIDYKLASAYVHYAEEMVGVYYRYLKSFTGTYIDENGKSSEKTYSMLVRDLKYEVTIITDEMDKALLDRNLYKKYFINDLLFGLIDMHGTIDVMKDDLKNNGGLVIPKLADTVSST